MRSDVRFGRRCSAALAAACAVAALAVGAATAAAAHVPLVPALQAAAGPDLVAAAGQMTCAWGWVTVTNFPSAYAVGNCRYGTPLARRACGSTPCDWSGGYVYGNYAGCGFISTAWLTGPDGGRSTGACGHPVLPIDAFASYSNCVPGSCTDGTPTTINRPCTEYGNYRPWSSSPGFSDPIRTYDVTNPNTPVSVWWRYITRNGAAVMVHDPNAGGPGNGNWVFVSSSCITDGYPAGFPDITYVGADPNPT